MQQTELTQFKMDYRMRNFGASSAQAAKERNASQIQENSLALDRLVETGSCCRFSICEQCPTSTSSSTRG